ncbi:MAG TPA: hypothetical protein VK256_02190 [Candidatus Eisenbacteria bacterium]|nr:hypothetical protein [Candidatus Eisenbacteria bacterium]
MALKLVMWVMGLLIVAGSGVTFIGSTIFNFDSTFGVAAPVAGVAFGAGLMIAGFDPIANVSWVRALILYAVLMVVYQVFLSISVGHFDIIAFVIAVIVAVLLLVLYPNKPALWMQGTMPKMGART